MIRSIVAAPRVLFLGLLIYAPWAYGCTVSWAIHGLELIAAAILALWVFGCVFTLKAPAIDRWNTACVAWLLGQGWLMALNAHTQFHARLGDKPHVFSVIPAWWQSGPGSVDGPASIAMMWRITALLGLLLFAGDMARDAVWRQRIWRTMAVAAGSMILYGLFQRVLGAPSIFWLGKPTDAAFFGTYYYHGNAGAFINLVFPLVAAMAWLSCRDERMRGLRLIALPAAGVSLAGACVNASRAGFAITFVLGCVLLAWIVQHSGRTGTLKGGRLLSAGVAVAAIITIAVSAGWETAIHKWSLLPKQLNGENPRLLAMSACVRMIRTEGAEWGFGPGTFEIAFPHYTAFLGRSIEGIWRFAHQDYLQTIIEWGYIGAAVWGLLFVRGLVICFIRAADHLIPEPERTLLFATGIALAGIALHAVIDFPLQIASLQLYVISFLAIAVHRGSKAEIVEVEAGSVVLPP